MKFLTPVLLFLTATLWVGCSKEAVPDDPIEMPEFTAIGESSDKIYQYDFRSFTEDGPLIDLTEAIGVKPGFLTLRQVNDQLSFYSFAMGGFTVRQWDTKTKNTAVFENFYTASDQRSITWGANSEDLLFLAYYSPKGSKNLNIRTFDPITETEIDLFIENSVLETYAPFYHNDKLFVTYLDAASEYHVVIVQPSTNTITVDLEFGASSPNIFIDNSGNLVILKRSQGTAYEYGIYDFETFVAFEEGTFELNRTYVPGYLNIDLFEGKLYYQNLYAQPSELTFGPAIYDFKTNTNTEIDLKGIIADFQEEFQTSIIPISQGFDLKSGSFLVGYGSTGNPSELEGGVLVISRKGMLLGHVELPFVPTYFIKSYDLGN